MGRMAGDMASKRRRYSDEERANAVAALAANAGNVSRTAAQLGIPAKTLENWAKGSAHPEAADNGEQKKAGMAAALDEIAWKLLGAIEGKIGDASLSHTATAMGIAIDKARLLRGEPTKLPDDAPGLIAVYADPVASTHAAALLERVTTRPDDAGRAGVARQPGPVGQPEAPHAPQP